MLVIYCGNTNASVKTYFFRSLQNATAIDITKQPGYCYKLGRHLRGGLASSRDRQKRTGNVCAESTLLHRWL